MKTLAGFAVLVLFAITAQSQNNHFRFVSAQQQQVKYDSENKLYFIDREFNNSSEITIEKNIISFVSGDNQKNGVYINNINLEPLFNKVSFTLEGRDILSGKPVKIGFWFIAGELEEVSYANEAFQHSIAYKNISVSGDALSGAMAVVHQSAR